MGANSDTTDENYQYWYTEYFIADQSRDERKGRTILHITINTPVSPQSGKIWRGSQGIVRILKV